MRDILVCKTCPHFRENQVMPSKIVNLRLDPKNVRKYTMHFRRRHECDLDSFSVKMGRIGAGLEYYNLGIPFECEYAMEHEIYEMNGEHGVVDYGVSRHFRMKRVCQHCGAEIQNRKTCPRCGYSRFDVFVPYEERIAGWCKVFALLNGICCAVCLLAYLIGLLVQE